MMIMMNKIKSRTEEEIM